MKPCLCKKIFFHVWLVEGPLSKGLSSLVVIPAYIYWLQGSLFFIMQKARKNNIEIYAGCLYFNVGPERRFWQPFLAPSSDMLDLFQSWHLQHLFRANLERRKKSHVASINKAWGKHCAFFLVYFGWENGTYSWACFKQ